MLDDFGKGGTAGRGRLGVSLAVSVVVFAAISTAVVVASAMVRSTFVEEDLVQVEFAPPPPPPEPLPPPPPVEPPPVVEAPPPRLGRPRPRLEQPEEIPEERPEESDRELTPPGDPFAPEGEGDPNGVAGGVGRAAPVAVAPPPEPAPQPPRPRGPQRVIEGTTPPQFDREAIVRGFVVPPEVRSAGIARITVVVRVTVGEDGSIQRVDVLRGHALIPNETIVRAVQGTRATPARMGDGTPYASIQTLPITLAITL
jgi:protein TonB